MLLGVAMAIYPLLLQLQERHPGRGDVELAWPADQERPVLRFKPLQVLAHRGLGEVELLGCASEAAKFGHGDQ